MTSCERVVRALEFRCPDRIPVRFGRLGCDDTAESGYKFIVAVDNAEARRSGAKEWVDEWECAWVLNEEGSSVDNMGYVREHPITDYALLRDHPVPDPDDPRRYEDIPAALEKAGDKYVIAAWFTLFERAWQLRGMTELFTDMFEAPEDVDGLLEIISGFTVRIIENLSRFKGRIHGFEMGDDWGTQAGLMMSLGQFRRFFKPHYKKIIDAAHSCGMHVWMHSDGKINELIEEFIELGLDAINLEQPLMLGIDDISRRYQGRIAFYPTLDLQRTLPSGSREEMGAQARELIEKWGTPQGGIIALDYWDYESIGIDENRARMALEAFQEHGRYT